MLTLLRADSALRWHAEGNSAFFFEGGLGLREFSPEALGRVSGGGVTGW